MLNMVLKYLNTFHNWNYFLLNVLGVLTMMGFTAYAARKNSLNWFNTLFYIAGVPLVFLVGIRLAYLFFYADLNNPAVHFFDLKLYGFSLYGGLILVIFYAALIARLCRIPVWNWLDVHALGLMSYVALGKIGCLINGCCFGIPTIMPWGIHYTAGSQAYDYYIVNAFNHSARHSWQIYSDIIHPVQLYESMAALVLLVLAFILLRKKILPGIVFFITVMLYSLTRLGLFYLRANPEVGPYFPFLPILYVIVVGLSLVLLAQRIYANRKVLMLRSELS